MIELWRLHDLHITYPIREEIVMDNKVSNLNILHILNLFSNKIMKY